MSNNKAENKCTLFDTKIKSKLHPDIYHTVRINLHCYERMPDEKSLMKQNKQQKITFKRKKETETQTDESSFKNGT